MRKTAKRTLALMLGAIASNAFAEPKTEDGRLNAFLDKAYDVRAAQSPQGLTREGSKQDYDKLDDDTPAAQKKRLALLQTQVAQMKRSFDPARLSPEARLSFELFEKWGREATEAARWREYDYMAGGPTTQVPSFLINAHRMTSVADAQAYISRLRDVERVMNDTAAEMNIREAKGLVQPKLIFAPAIGDAQRVITGAPFTEGPDSPVWVDFKKKVDKVDTDAATRARLLAEAEAALKGPFLRGYRKVIAILETEAAAASTDDGVWRLPDGDAYYASLVRNATTTDLTPDQIHQIGLREMTRIRGEMETVKARIGFQGDLQALFAEMKTSPALHYPDTEAGRAQYLTDARAAIDHVMAAAPKLFNRLPKAPLEVRAVETWREATAIKAYYSPGAPDGSRPAVYYVNLGDLGQTLKTQVEAIACHEGSPGHHFQGSFAEEIPNLPKFRQYEYGNAAYAEGWALYAEGLCKELGLYQDAYADLGRLSLDAWRAARLVIDTGLHAKRWTRAQAIDYFKQNTLVSDRDVEREVDRYLTYPGQATSYKIGQLKILELRGKAEAALGSRFDVRDFHDVILAHGNVPLKVLEEQVDLYIAAKR